MPVKRSSPPPASQARPPTTSAPPRAPASTPPPERTQNVAASRPVHHRDDLFETPPPRAREANAVAEREALPPRPLRVVVTGYGDFAGTWNEAEGRPNPSGVLAAQLAELGLQNATVEYRKLEVTHGAVEAFMSEIRDNPPDVVISMGVSSKAQVEERPQNWKGNAIDGHGNRIVEGAISDGFAARERIRTDLPVNAIEAALREAASNGALPNRTVGTDDPALHGESEDYSPDDSAYLCNYLNFRLTETFGQDDRVTAGFVHVTPQTTAEEIQVIAQSVVNRELERRADLHG